MANEIGIEQYSFVRIECAYCMTADTQMCEIPELEKENRYICEDCIGDTNALAFVIYGINQEPVHRADLIAERREGGLAGL